MAMPRFLNIVVECLLARTRSLQTTGTITTDPSAALAPRARRTFSVTIRVSPGVPVGSRHLVEGRASAYGVSSVPKVKQSIRIRK